MPKKQKRVLRLFARAVVPPERFHSTKRGKKGYQRRRVREEEQQAKQDGLGEAPRPG